MSQLPFDEENFVTRHQIDPNRRARGRAADELIERQAREEGVPHGGHLVRRDLSSFG